ncbi:MAG: coproporphyrinogen dehydrogenase HemZ, partial [Eubacterium sp.]|nr:coproporphyrinogen dehydrogenase HemZ [Eubacterium sp.]
MVLKNINHSLGYHTQKIVTMFFPYEKIKSDGEDNNEVVTKIENNTLTVEVKLGEAERASSCELKQGGDVAMAMSVLLFRLLSEMTGFRPPWGILYGVRPARLMHAKTEELGREGAIRYFGDSLVLPEKTELALEVTENENRIISLSEKNSCSLYISIPFCPSRCAYCSFVSHSIENAAGLIDGYVDLLVRELEATAEVIKNLSLKLETVYFGGGTPTVLSPAQLEKLLRTVEKSFDISCLRELTVEAGRPDTVTVEKLRTLKAFDVSRISINPQTFNDKVLENIGRRHTSADTLSAFELARKLGFDNINMDFIAGLSGDTLASFKNSVDTACRLGTESVTLHNLALKSAAYLVTENETASLSDKALPFEMLSYAYGKLKENGYIPYYMYRQSKSLGNLENTGWCKPNHEGLYNVFMMDETHTVLAAGAGAVTKLK